ncbi:transporter substrate-binding domain-containing protein [Rhizobium puerariae]|uniref:Transporter substrate-binding domain-containing protein n=1 Tax=Rhizobium puerariae TaxID=1585791 RepID=A0ABV6ACH7_9HYPH
MLIPMKAFRRTIAAYIAFALAPLLVAGAAGAEPLVDLTKQTQLQPGFEKNQEVHSLLPEAIRKAGEINVALAVGIAPVNFPGEKPGEVRGLTADLVTGLEQVLGIKFKTTIFPNTASQLLALESGQVDLTVSTNGDTLERQKSFTFVDYILSTNSIVVAKGNPLGIAKALDVCGKVYGEVKGSFSVYGTFEKVCKGAGLPTPTLSSFDDAPSMMLSLASGRVNAYAGSTFNTIYQQSQGVPVEDVPLPEAGELLLGMTVARNDQPIADAVNAALQVLVKNGYYKQALEHWGLGAYAIQPGVNLAAK